MEIRFPEPHTADENGIVAMSDGLTTALLRAAYRQGIFPWPVNGWNVIPWFCPAERAVLEFANLNVSRSLRRVRRAVAEVWECTIDRAFPLVIKACSEAPRPLQESTWITDEVIAAYCALHREGWAHSVEVWENKELIGGLYGVDAGGVFVGESMFHRRSDASKIALLHLIDHLQARGADWLDAQVMTPHFARLGAHSIARHTFISKLRHTQARRLKIFG